MQIFKQILTVSIFIFLGKGMLFSQTAGINYHALILNSEEIRIPGSDVQNNQVPIGLEEVSFRFSITNEASLDLYIEEQTTTTDENGMVSLIVGSGTPSFSTFDALEWNGILKYLNVEIDIHSQNQGYVFLDTQKILYLPQSGTGELADASVTPVKISSGGNDKVLVTDATGAVAWIDKTSLTGGDVQSVFGRAGVVTATSGDYNAGEITNTPAGNIAAITAQTAINELDTEKLSTTLTSTNLLVGNGSNLATGVALSGDATLANTGALTIADDAVDGTDISIASEATGSTLYYDGTDWIQLGVGTAGQMLSVNAGATAPEWTSATAGSLTNLSDVNTATATAGNFLLADGTDFESVALSGDATIAATGALTIADNSVDGTDISIASEAAGDVTYFNGTDWIRLAKGTAGQRLVMNTGATAPEWQSATAGSLTNLSDVNTATATAGNFLLADGTDFESVALSGDATIAATGALTIADNSVDGTDISIASEAAGDVTYFNGTDWIRLAKGTAGQRLVMNTGATAPEWQSGSTTTAPSRISLQLFDDNVIDSGNMSGFSGASNNETNTSTLGDQLGIGSATITYSNGTDITRTLNQFNIITAGVYEVFISFTMNDPFATDNTYTLQMANNGTVIAASATSQDGANGNPANMVIKYVGSFSASDVLRFHMNSNGGGWRGKAISVDIQKID